MVKLIAKLVLAAGAAAAPVCGVKSGQHQDKGSSVRGTEERRQVQGLTVCAAPGPAP